MEDNISNLNFLKETVSQFKGEIQKMIANSNYTSTNVIQLKQTVEEMEKNISNREKIIVSNFLNSKKAHTAKRMAYHPSSLPQISQPGPRITSFYPEEEVYTSIKYMKQSTLDRLKDHRNRREINNEKEFYKHNMAKRYNKGDIQQQNEMRMLSFQQNKEEKRLLGKHNILANSEFYEDKKATVRMPNFMNKDKLMQYSSLNRKYHNDVLYDHMKQPIIKKDELEKGLLNMIYKGLIPKGADLTPAFESNGHPLQFNMKMKKDFSRQKGNEKDDINEMSQKFDQFKIDLKDDNFFITKPLNNHIENLCYDNQLNEEIKQQPDIINEKDINKDSFSINLSLGQSVRRKTLLFYNFSVKRNEELRRFNQEHQDKWGAIEDLFGHLSKLFRKLHLTLVEVYQDAILQLATDEMKTLKQVDLLMCITEKDLQSKGIDPQNPDIFYENIKECFIIKIQLASRSFLARKKLAVIRDYFSKIRKIQNIYKSSLLIAKARSRAEDLLQERYSEWKTMMSKFQSRWEIIKSLPHVEIHFNSISTNTSNAIYLNTTRQKFVERENNQLNRIINLNDPNVEMIYISPNELKPEVIGYYSSVLATLGVDNIKERFHVVVPSACETLPPHYSITQLALLSPDTMKKIKTIIGTREAFIVPGVGGKTEVELSMLLDIPILMGDLFQTQTKFSKSGAKMVFEANDLPVSFSAWDIEKENDFFASLAYLITSYPEINVWIFKMDHESNGRGIAYMQLDKMSEFLELKKNYITNCNTYNSPEQLAIFLERYKAQISDMLKISLPKKVKIVANLLYKSWEEYFQEFIKYRGVIEACPTSHPNNIIGSPCIPILIEPNGTIEQLPSFDKINYGIFRNIAAVSPQKSYQSNELEEKALKIGKYLFEHNIFGYVTIEYIIFHRGDNQNVYWAIDLKFGLSDMIASINFCHFLYSKAIDRMQGAEFNISLNQDKSGLLMNKCDVFTIPFFAHSKIANLKINDLVKSFRLENLIFDIEMKKGIMFNLSDTLQCGSMGICGILNTEDLEEKAEIVELWKMIQFSCRIIELAIKLNEYQPTLILDQRTDMIETSDIFNRIYKCANQIGTDKEKGKKGPNLSILHK